MAVPFGLVILVLSLGLLLLVLWFPLCEVPSVFSWGLAER